MKRAAFALALLVVGIAFAQSQSVRICDKDNSNRCVNLTQMPAADGGSTTSVDYAVPTAPAGIQLNTLQQVNFVNCAGIGTASQNIGNGRWLFRVTDEDVTLTVGHTYDGGNGGRMQNGLAVLLNFYSPDGGTMVACASDGGVGDALFTKVR